MSGKSVCLSYPSRNPKKLQGETPKRDTVTGQRIRSYGSVGILVMVLSGGSSVAASDELTGAYTKLVLLSASDDINVSSFHSEGMKYDSYSLPWQSDWVGISDNLSLSGSLRAAWLDARSPETLDVASGAAELHSRWTVGSLGGGVLMRYRVTPSFVLKGGVESGVITIRNRSRLTSEQTEWYYPEMKALGLLDWSADLVRVSPSVGMTFQQLWPDRDSLTLDSRLSWHILCPVAGDRGNVETGAGTWSLRAEYRFADVFDVAGTPVDILLSEQPGGFWGRGYRDIDFGFITETGVAAEAPVSMGGTIYRLRLGAGWLKNDTGTGVSVILGLY